MMNLKQVRVVDPVLSKVAVDYTNPDDGLVGNYLFPRVFVLMGGGTSIEFGKESFRKYSLKRAPGADVKRIAFGYSGKPFNLTQDAFDVQMPQEHIRDAKAAAGLDLGIAATKKGMAVAKKSLEDEQAAVAITAANYPDNNKVTLAGAAKWSAATGTPIDDVSNARAVIRGGIGLEPNTLMLSYTAYEAVKNNQQVIDRFKYTNATGLVTAAALAILFDVKNVVIGKGVSASDADVMSDIWGNNAILAYVAQNQGGDTSLTVDTPSFGLTYTMDGHPMVAEPYWDDSTRSWMYPFAYERVPLMTSNIAGFLFQNPA